MRVMVVLVRSDFVLVFALFDVASKALGDRRADVVKRFVERHKFGLVSGRHFRVPGLMS